MCQSLITLHVDPDPSLWPLNIQWQPVKPHLLGLNLSLQVGQGMSLFRLKMMNSFMQIAPCPCAMQFGVVQMPWMFKPCVTFLHILELLVDHPTFFMGAVSRLTNQFGARVAVPGSSIPLHHVTYPTHGQCILTGVCSLSMWSN